MLTRNCVTNLFKKDDFNVRVSVFDKNPAHYLPKAYYNAWIDMITDSLGGGLLNSGKEIIMVFTRTSKEQNGHQIISDQIPEYVRSDFTKAEPMRIDIIKNNEKHSWIFLLNENL